MAGAGLAVALLARVARALPGGSARVLLWRAGVPGKDLAGGSCGSPRQGSCRGSLSSNPHLILNIRCFRKDLHASTEVPPKPWPNVVDGVWGRGLKGWLALLVWRAALARVLPGLLRLSRQGPCRGNLLRPFALCGLGLWCCLVYLGFGFASVHLPCLATSGRGAWR